jgi:type IV pilus assembly protein PilQ
VLRIETLENLTRQKQQELQARIASEMSAQRITRIFPISYARINELATILQSFAVPRVQGAQGGTPDTNAIVIQSDQRTNSLIVQGTPETVERIRKLIQLLDTQTPQVMIEAKIVEASERFSRSLGGSMGLATGRSFASFNGGDPSAVLQAQASTGGSALFGSAPVVGFLPGVQRLNALLSISESENETKIITSPRVVVLNRQAANITQTQPVLINVLTINNGVQTVTPQQLNANISLNVTPTVTNDGSVLLDLNLQRDVPTGGGQPTIANRNMKTSVIVDSGSTLVVGGIFSNDEINSESGMPFLRKIPIIGTLLGDKQKSTARSELFFFVTPKILNQSESGLQTGSNT